MRFLVLKIDTHIDVTSEEFALHMEHALARTYEEGFKRLILMETAKETASRRRRATTEGTTTVQVIFLRGGDILVNSATPMLIMFHPVLSISHTCILLQVIEAKRVLTSLQNTEVLHMLERGGILTPSMKAVSAMNTLTEQEQALKIGYVVVSASERTSLSSGWWMFKYGPT